MSNTTKIYINPVMIKRKKCSCGKIHTIVNLKDGFTDFRKYGGDILYYFDCECKSTCTTKEKDIIGEI